MLVSLALVISLFLFADSKAHILFFKESPSANQVINCKVISELDDVQAALKSKDDSLILSSTRKLIIQLNAAYGFETKFKIFQSRASQQKDSPKAKRINQTRLKLEKFSKMKIVEISKNIENIRLTINEAQRSLKDLC